MASAEKRTPRNEERTISRTYRAAIRLGEDFITLEETVTLPIDASDEEVAQAVELGWKIYRAQRSAVEQQVASVRETAGPLVPSIQIKDPDSPASEKQRGYIATLQDQLGWSSEQLVAYAREQQVDLVTLTKGHASTFIDGLKKLAEDHGKRAAEEREAYDARPRETPPARQPEGALANEKQLTALLRLAQHHGYDLDSETEHRYGLPSSQISAAQASLLLKEWQPRRA
ncbi:MAG: hypothetical protein Fur005_20110 [Roseiflexaceae bacterium]